MSWTATPVTGRTAGAFALYATSAAGRTACAFAVCAALLIGGCRSGEPAATRSDEWGTLEQPDSEKLPKAMSVKASSADDAAARLAAAARSDDPREAVSALLAALHMSGIAVADRDLGNQIVRAPAEPAQGIAVQPGEVIAMQRLLAAGHTVLTRDAAEIIRHSFAPDTEVDAAGIEELLLAGVREHANGDHPTLRFWARFIVELGRQNPDGLDILAAPGEDHRDLLDEGSHPTTFDAAQLVLINWRFAADLNGLAHRLGSPDHAGTASVPQSPVLFASQSPALFAPQLPALAAPHAPVLLASILPAPRFGALLRAATANTSDCNFSEKQSPMMDVVHNTASTGFGELIDYIVEKQAGEAAAEAAELASKALGVLIGFGKAFLQASLTEAKIEFVDGSNELRRLKGVHRDGGETKPVRGTVELNAGGLRYLNCARSALNAIGLDASLPGDGAIKGAKLTWWIDKEGQSGIAAAQNALVRYAGNQKDVPTDSAGQAVVNLQGMPQKHNIEGRPPEIRKRATIGFSYHLKESDLKQDLIDAFFSVVGGPSTIPAELFLRTMTKGVKRTITVIDYGSDYRIDHVINGVRFTATQCGTPTGIWEIDISGDLGMGMSVSGVVYVGINEQSYNGRFRGELDVNLPDFASQHMSFDDIGFSGVAALLSSSSRLVLETRGTQGAIRALKSSIPIAGPGNNLSLPFETGAFCTDK